MALIDDGEFEEEHIIMANNNQFFQEEQVEPVLKHAASVFFADMSGTATYFSEGLDRSSGTSTATSTAKPLGYPFSTSYWLNPVKEVLIDSSDQLPRDAAMDRGGAVEEDLICFEELEGVSMKQHSKLWDAPFIGKDFLQLGRSVQPPAPHDDLSKVYYVDASSSQLGNGKDSALENSGVGVNVQDKAAASEDGFVEPLYSRVRSQEENLDFEDFKKYEHDSDSLVLVSSIANLSKALLSCYEARDTSTSNASQQASRKALQSTIFDLSKCLLHAQELQQQSAPVDHAFQEMSLVEKSKSALEEGPSFGYTDEQHPDPEHDGGVNMQVLYPGTGRHVTSIQAFAEVDDSEESEDEQQEEEQQQSCSYLNSNQVEQRLALLRARRNWNDEEDEEVAAKLADEGVDAQDNYIAEHKKQMTAEEKQAELCAKSCRKEVDETGTCKPLDRTSESEDDSSWERI